MLACLPLNVLAQILEAGLGQMDTAALRATCRGLRRDVDCTARWPTMCVRAMDAGFRAFVQKATARTTTELRVTGSIDWEQAIPTFSMLGSTVKSAWLSSAPVTSNTYYSMVSGLGGLERLRVDCLVGNSFDTSNRPSGLRALDLRSTPASRQRFAQSRDQDDLRGTVGNFVLRFPLEELVIVTDRHVDTFYNTGARDVTHRLAIVHDGFIAAAKYLEWYTCLETVILHATRVNMQDAPVIPGVRNASVPARYADEALAIFEDLRHLHLVTGDGDENVTLDLEDLDSLTIEFRDCGTLTLLCDTPREHEEWARHADVHIVASVTIRSSVLSANGETVVDVPPTRPHAFSWDSVVSWDPAIGRDPVAAMRCT